MKIVIVVDEKLPLGLAANAAAVLAFSASPSLTGCVGESVMDRSGTVHPGITAVPLPVLAASSSNLAELKEAAGSAAGAAYIAFSDIAQRSKNYEEYTRAMRTAAPESLQYVGLCIYGEDRAVRSLTGSLRLLGS